MTASDVLAEDIDALPDIPLPRDNTELFGHEQAERDFLAALAGGRLPHAWLIGGVEGVGKATFAYRMARAILRHGLSAERGRVSDRAVSQLAHPDLIVIRRGLDKKSEQVRAAIRVEDVREAMRRVSSTASAGGWRVVIVDTADDFNEACANALLKSIEEPPPMVAFLILSHQPGLVKTTIRSRCRRLMLAPLDEADVASAVTTLMPQAGSALAGRAARHAQGSPGRALRLISKNWLDFVDEVEAVLCASPHAEMGKLAAFAEKLDGKGREDVFRLFRETLQSLIAARVAEFSLEPQKRGAAAFLAEEGMRVDRLLADSAVYKLQRRHLVHTQLAQLQALFHQAAKA